MNPEAEFHGCFDSELVAYIKTRFKGCELAITAWYKNFVWTGRIDYSGACFAFGIDADLFLPSLAMSLLGSVLEDRDVDWWLGECARLHASMPQ